MRRLLAIVALAAVASIVGACSDSDDQTEFSEWRIALDDEGVGIHTVFMIRTFTPLREADVEDLGGRLVWEETEIELCAIGIRSVGDEFLQIGDIFQTTEGCAANTGMQQAFDEFGLPESACVFVRANGVDDEYCAPLAVGRAEPPPDEPEFELPDPSLLPPARAPLGLGDVALPDDAEGITAVFDDLPAVLLGGERSIEPSGPDRVAVSFGVTQPVGCSSIGFQGIKVSPDGGTGDQFVAVLTTGADWEVDGYGRDGDLFWVTWNTTCGIADEPGEDSVVNATWATAGSPWFYSATAGTSADLDELLVAFVSAAA